MINLMASTMVHRISRTTVQSPMVPPSFAGKRYDLTPWDLTRLPQHYTQAGFLYANIPVGITPLTMAENLQASLSLALFQFYPLGGRFLVETDLDEKTVSVSLNCTGEGAEFLRATASDVSVSTVLDFPARTQGFFPLEGALNYDGHELPLFAAQLTELDDGVFLGCSFNHGVADGNSFYHFVKSWAEISRAIVAGGDARISRPPVHDRWFLEGVSKKIKLQLFSKQKAIVRYSPSPTLQHRFFQFSRSALDQLREKANEESGSETISSFQTLSSLVWKCITRARGLSADTITTCLMPFDNRLRLKPRLPRDYFGNAVDYISASVSTCDLLTNSVKWGSRKLNESVISHTDSAIRRALTEWLAKPELQPISSSNPHSIIMTGSPRYDAYNGLDFGWGVPVGLRGGEMNKFDGLVMCWPGRQGRGSIELEICLLPDAMSELEKDQELMQYVNTTLPPCRHHEEITAILY